MVFKQALIHNSVRINAWQQLGFGLTGLAQNGSDWFEPCQTELKLVWKPQAMHRTKLLNCLVACF